MATPAQVTAALARSRAHRRTAKLLRQGLPTLPKRLREPVRKAEYKANPVTYQRYAPTRDTGRQGGNRESLTELREAALARWNQFYDALVAAGDIAVIKYNSVAVTHNIGEMDRDGLLAIIGSNDRQIQQFASAQAGNWIDGVFHPYTPAQLDQERRRAGVPASLKNALWWKDSDDGSHNIFWYHTSNN